MKNSTELTDVIWNPTLGCTKVSEGCKNCYAEVYAEGIAESIAFRRQLMGTSGYENEFEISLRHHRLEIPLKRKKPTVYFVNSMSDLFHKAVPFSYVDRVIDVIAQTPQHTYQLLTKRAERMSNYFADRTVPKNLWLGVSVEDKTHGLPRINHLRHIKASVLFLSAEPLLEDLGPIDLTNIDWVIVGGETGPKARPIKEDWIITIKDQCVQHDIPFFFKQWGVTQQGKTCDMYPTPKERSCT